MKTILHIEASSRKSDKSISKTLAQKFSMEWQRQRYDDKIIYRDLGQNPPTFISEEWIAAVFTADGERTDQQRSLLSLSDTLIDEVNESDIILMSTPMYNYGMPATLKAWFDQVIRVDKTFSFDLRRGDFPLEPIMSGKTLVLISSSGEFGFDHGGIREAMNHLGPHIKVLSKYLGVDSFYEIQAEYQEFGDLRHEHSVTEAHAAVIELAGRLTQELTKTA